MEEKEEAGFVWKSAVGLVGIPLILSSSVPARAGLNQSEDPVPDRSMVVMTETELGHVTARGLDRGAIETILKQGEQSQLEKILDFLPIDDRRVKELGSRVMEKMPDRFRSQVKFARREFIEGRLRQALDNDRALLSFENIRSLIEGLETTLGSLNALSELRRP